MKVPLRVFTVFSGIGSVEEALKQLARDSVNTWANEIVGACDFDVYCKKTYFANHNIKYDLWHDDIKKMNSGMNNGEIEIPTNIDLLVGGSPCQSFSLISGRGQHLNDEKGKLFYDYINSIRILQPKVFIWENVVNVLKIDNGKVWEQIHSLFKQTGYSIKFFNMNAKDYGLPQNRNRLFVIGFKQRLDKTEIFRKPLPVFLQKCLKDMLEFKTTQHDERVINTLEYKNAIPTKNYFNKSLSYNFAIRVEKPLSTIYNASTFCSTSGLCRTVTTKDIVIIDNNFYRLLTPRECFRLQGFDDNFIINKVSERQQKKQAGNAMCINVLKALFKQIYFTGVFSNS